MAGEPRPKDIVIQPDGKILAHRFTENGGGSTNVITTRQLPNGSADPGFACLLHALPPEIGAQLFLQPDGKIMYFVGLNGNAYRYYADGNYDMMIPNILFYPSVVQPDQKIVAAWAMYPDYQTIRVERKLLD